MMARRTGTEIARVTPGGYLPPEPGTRSLSVTVDLPRQGMRVAILRLAALDFGYYPRIFLLQLGLELWMRCVCAIYGLLHHCAEVSERPKETMRYVAYGRECSVLSEASSR
jgi:hypothetical protein